MSVPYNSEVLFVSDGFLRKMAQDIETAAFNTAILVNSVQIMNYYFSAPMATSLLRPRVNELLNLKLWLIRSVGHIGRALIVKHNSKNFTLGGIRHILCICGTSTLRVITWWGDPILEVLHQRYAFANQAGY